MNQNSTSARSWGTIVTHSDEMAIIYRYVDAFHDDWDLSSQPDRIIIAWRYEDETGMPAPNEREHMEELEAALAPVVEEDGCQFGPRVDGRKPARMDLLHAVGRRVFQSPQHGAGAASEVPD
jgi:hypothetical protein